MNKFLCFLFGHKYFVTQKYTQHFRKVGCYCCHQEWSMNDRHECFLPWDAEFDEIAKFEMEIY